MIGNKGLGRELHLTTAIYIAKRGESWVRRRKHSKQTSRRVLTGLGQVTSSTDIRDQTESPHP